MKLSVLDLFSGIGGFSLGLEATGGFETAAFCEINPYARRVLAHHWPEVPIHGSVVDLCGADITADVICGGFPCQDISLSGSGAGLDGDRSGLWFQFLRLINEIRPRWAIIENVSALRGRGLDTVLRGLAAIGYDAEWHCVPASALGAVHQRDRVWIVAYPAGIRRTQVLQHEHLTQASETGQPPRVGAAEIREWPAAAVVCRASDAIPHRLDRVRALGNAIVPVMAYVIGRAILEAEG